MKKYDEIRMTDKFTYLDVMFNNLKEMKVKFGDSYLISNTQLNLMEFAGYEYMKAYRFKQHYDVIRDYCEKFFECKEKGFGYQLGCRYQKISFDFTSNIDGEINWLKGLLNIYSDNFPQEIQLIKSLIIDLEKFKPHFDEYLNS